MSSRIVASIILVVGLGAILWVAFGANDTESATPPAVIQAATDNDLEPGEGDVDDEEDPVEQSVSSDDTQREQNDADPPARDAGAGGLDPAPTPTPDVDTPENFGPRMDLVDIDGWLNTDATSIDDFNGKVLLVEMWTFGCSNCKARIPFNQSYYEEFADENFEILGVHAPEFSFEADVDNIIEAAERLGVTWPIALDTDKRNFRAWQPGSTNYWPRTYVIDQNGDIRYDHIGEGKYEELRETIRFLVENPPAPNPAP